MYLKQSTTITVKMGPFLDKTDGVTEETGLTPGVEVSKNGGAFAARNSATAVSHDAEGWYGVELNATDTGTLGRLQVKAQDAANHLPVWHEFMVVPANAYDSLVGGTDTLQADVTQLGGVTQSATDLKDFADAGYDPATNKVQGVVLVDTTTTNTDMRGTDSAMLAASYTAPDNTGIGDILTDTGTTLPAQISGLNNFDPAADTVANVTTVAGVSGAVGSVTGNVGGNVSGSVASVTDKTGFTLATSEHTSIADALLKRDWTAVSGEAARSVLNALRFLRNKWAVTGASNPRTLTVYKEDDTTSAWTSSANTTAGDPVSDSDPT